MKKALVLALLAVSAALSIYALVQLRVEEKSVETTRAMPAPEALATHCEEAIGEKRVVSIGDRIHVAVGFDLANVILVRTEVGHVIIDAAMSPSRAREAKEALLAVAEEGPVAALILTHSHIDHVGGATVFADDATPIWATDAFADHFIKQYGVFRKIETIRGARQFGVDLPAEDLPCIGLGERLDFDATLELGVRMPTHTFSGETRFTVGDLTFELVEAHGETHDQLFVHVPELGALFPGDNYYQAFPNLYTIRGTSPRDVDAWIESLDAMRRRDPAVLVPSHTLPLEGREHIREALTTYRDGIQYVRDAVVRDANAGLDADVIAERAALPVAIAGAPSLAEFYGQVDWSARAIYGNALGWFDGRPETLYPLARDERAAHLVEFAGGRDRVLARAREAREKGEHSLSVELLAMLRDASNDDPVFRPELAASLRALAAGIANTNGRSYLLESAMELEGHVRTRNKPVLNEAFIQAIPIQTVFEIMASRLIPERAVDVHESVRFQFEGDEADAILTLRNGVLEIARGEALPGTPAPLVTLFTDAATWRRLAVDAQSPAEALVKGELRVEGDVGALLRFLQRFERGV